ncbi:Speckle-type POZ protein, partial [Araneus ventricosus]
MTTPESYPEEECFNIFWKIKEFSYCCAQVRSPEFSFLGNQYFILLVKRSPYIECNLVCSAPHRRSVHFTMQISFLTCDGSPEHSVSGGKYICLPMPRNVIFDKRRNSFLPEDTLTVRFRILTDSERGKLSICSQIVVKRKYFLWTIKDFTNYATRSNQQNTKKSVEKCESYGDIELALKPVDRLNAPGQFEIEISRTGGERCYGCLRVSLLDVDGKARYSASDEFGFSKNTPKTWSFPFVVKKSKLLARRNLLLPNDTLSLKCYFVISLGSSVDQESVLSYYEDVAPLVKESDSLSVTFKESDGSCYATELQTDLKSMLDDGTLLDVGLRVGSEVVQAHKIILSARSAVFRAMFTRDMKETIDSAVVIEDLSAETVRKLVLYMYTDTVPDCQWEDMKELYFAADKYQVQVLKKKCVTFLKTKLSVPNVCEALILADLHRDADLKAAALDFIFEHNSAVFDSAEWKEMG